MSLGGSTGSRKRKLTGAEKAATSVPERAASVLVVEDDPDLQWRLTRMLTLKGHRVVGTSSGEGALALLAEWPVDLVLVDEDLPGMSGVEVVARVRVDHPAIPVVMMTGSDGPEAQLAARLAGAVALLAKPFQLDALFELVAPFFEPLPDPAE